MISETFLRANIWLPADHSASDRQQATTRPYWSKITESAAAAASWVMIMMIITLWPRNAACGPGIVEAGNVCESVLMMMTVTLVIAPEFVQTCGLRVSWSHRHPLCARVTTAAGLTVVLARCNLWSSEQ